MKGISIFTVLLCLMLLPVLTACSIIQKDYGDEYIFGQDSQDFKRERTAAYTENGFYTINKYADRIDYIDLSGNIRTEFGTQEFNSPQSLISYNGYLYLLDMHGSGLILFKLNYDCEIKSEVNVLDEYSSVKNFTIHRGYGYAVASKTDVETGRTFKYLVKITLSSGKTKDIFYASDDYEMELLFAKGNNVYFSAETREGNGRYAAYRYNILSKEVTELDIPKGVPALLNGRDGRCRLIAQEYVKKDENKEEAYDVLYTHRNDGTMNGVIYATYYNEDGECVTKELSGMQSEEEAYIFYDNKYIYEDNKKIFDGKTEQEEDTRYICINRCVLSSNDSFAYIEPDMSLETVWSDTEHLLMYDKENDSYVVYDLESGEEREVSNGI